MNGTRIMVIQHIAIEPTGIIGETLQSEGCRLEHFGTGQQLPGELDAFDGIIVMGGFMSANDTHLPFIRNELALLEQAIARGTPMLGICLGAQLMARAAGATVSAAPLRELGWYRVSLTAEGLSDPLFAALPADGMEMFQWHGETFSLPQTALLMATGAEVANQAFRLGRGQYGLQFHAEIDAAMVEAWIEAGSSEREHLGADGIAAVRDGLASKLPPMQQCCRQMALAWLELVSNDPCR